jgi:peptidoglycan/LPS O-acetylase OafA/YrhL
VGRLAILFGVVLAILGIALYVGSEPRTPGETKSMTRLIPMFLGLALMVLGGIALNEKYRKHAMHGAALVGLIGVIGGTIVGVIQISGERPATAWGGSFAMAALSAVFLALCVKSFIEARRRRRNAS